MKNLYIILILILGISGSTIPHPNGLVIPEADSTSNCSYYSLDLIAGYNGICFGNSEYCNGFRINFSDCGVKRVSGLNCTFWKGYSNTLQDFTVYGISFGVFPTAGTMKGITIGLAGVQAFHEMDGINLTCMALVGQKANLKGLNFGGMAI
ncbi:MAG: hypothetical protein LWX56_02695, partial [Ignavibacteria bacterium]|nr:hypothetical protein [Ignavibacteria bacterium]